MPSNPKIRRRIRFLEPAAIALQTLRSHKLRSFLTLLGMILSVGTLIVVWSMISGTNVYISERVANFGANVFLVTRFPIVTNTEDFVKLQRRNRAITMEDYEFVRDHMSFARTVAFNMGRNTGTAKSQGE